MSNRKSYCMLVMLGAVMSFFWGCATFKPYAAPHRDQSAADVQARLQTLLDEAVNEFRLPGIQAGIHQANGMTILAASGTIDLERKELPIGLQDSFRIGSTTKLFVAALICRMVEQGTLSLDEGISRWFPGRDWARTIAVRDLLQQTSGIPESLFTDPGILFQSALDGAKRWVPAEVADTIMKNVKLPPPESRKFVYSNNNYLLLGLIAEQCGERPLADLLDTEFFAPLGMTDTWLLPYRTSVPEHFVPGYDEYLPFGPHWLDGDATAWDSLTFSAGALASSAADLLKWLDALFHDRILKPESLALMANWIDARNNGRDNDIVGYGLGLAQYDLGGRQLRGHPGGGFGGECFPFYWPDRDISVVVSYNLSRKDNPAGKAVLIRMLNLIEK